MADSEEKDPPGSFLFIIPQRVILAIMGFLAIANAYTMRVCLNTAITQLVIVVNKTKETIKEGDVLCEKDFLDTGPVTGGDYDWSQELQGQIISSFYIGYLITHIPGGILADKFGGKWTLGLGIFSTSIFTIITPPVIEAGGAYALIALRILVGLGEGTTFPALSVLLAQWVPVRERGILGALVLGGGQIGSILGNNITGLLLKYYTWPVVFYFFGIVAVLWFVIFVLICSSDPISHPYIKVKEKKYLISEMGSISRNRNLPPIPWGMIFTSVPMYALISAQIGHDFGFYIMISDLPKYMNDVMQFSIAANGFYSSLPYLFMWICSLSSGAIADCIISKNYMSITNVRKMMTGIAAFGPAIFIVLASYSGCNRFFVVLCFTIAMGLMGAYYAGMKLSPLDMGPNYAGTLMAISNGIGSITGIIAPNVVGIMTPNTTMMEWRLVFWVAFIVLFVTAIVYCIWASGEIQPFNDPPPKKKKGED